MSNKIKLCVVLLGGLFFTTSVVAQNNKVKISTEKAVGTKVALTVNKCKKPMSIDWGDGKPISYDFSNATSFTTFEGTVKGKDIVISGQSDWYMLDCSNCGITNLDLTEGKELRSLYCQHNELTSINLKGMKKLVDLDCSYNQIEELVFTDASKPNHDLPSITCLNISNNKMEGRYLYPLETLQHLDASNNSFKNFYVFEESLRSLNIAGNQVKNTMNFKNCTNFTSLMCDNNHIMAVSFYNNGQNMHQISCKSNDIRSIDIAQGSQMTELICSNNRIKDLQVNPNAKFFILALANNSLTFSSLPGRRDKPKYLLFDPQAPFDISMSTGMLEKDGEYYAPISEWSKKYDEYIDISKFCKLSNDKLDVRYKIFAINADGSETELVQGNSSAEPGDYYCSYGKLTFFTAHKKVYIQLTSKSYGFVVKSLPFAVGAEMTAIDNVKNENGSLLINVYADAIQLHSDQPQKVAIYTVSGKNVWTNEVNGNVTVTLPKGVYVVNGKKVIL